MSPKAEERVVEALETIAVELSHIDDNLDSIAENINMIRKGEKYPD